MMRHLNAFATVVRGDSAHAQAAAEHMAACPDCWRLLKLLDAGANGDPVDDPAVVRECDDVRDVMHELVSLDLPAMAARHPVAVRHLGWCLACRERLADLLEIDAAFADGTLSFPLLAPETSAWRDAADGVRELVGRLVVRVRERVAEFAVFPDVATPAFGLALEPSRSAPAATTAVNRIRLSLEEAATVELELVAVGTDRVEIVLRADDESCDGVWLVRLRDLASDGADLVAAQTVRPRTPLVFKGVPAARYRLEISAPDKRSWWVPLDVTAGV